MAEDHVDVGAVELDRSIERHEHAGARGGALNGVRRRRTVVRHRRVVDRRHVDRHLRAIQPHHLPSVVARVAVVHLPRDRRERAAERVLVGRRLVVQRGADRGARLVRGRAGGVAVQGAAQVVHVTDAVVERLAAAEAVVVPVGRVLGEAGLGDRRAAIRTAVLHDGDVERRRTRRRVVQFRREVRRHLRLRQRLAVHREHVDGAAPRDRALHLRPPDAQNEVLPDVGWLEGLGGVELGVVLGVELRADLERAVDVHGEARRLARPGRGEGAVDRDDHVLRRRQAAALVQVEPVGTHSRRDAERRLLLAVRVVIVQWQAVAARGAVV